MRITNKIIQNNNLANINTNKVYQDTLSTQMSTQKRISRPSDDPVVAIRALRLRSSVTEITQYYSKNIPDAESWLSVTEDALTNLSQIMTSMIDQCTKGANGDLKTEDRQIILEQLQALSDEVYATGNADYAGRYVFTGYRTDTSLSFDKAQKLSYEITEQIDSSAIDTVTVVNTDDLLDLNSSNYNTDPDVMGIVEDDITSVEVYRIRLAYNNCDTSRTRSGGGTPVITYLKQDLDNNGNPIYDADGNPSYTRETLEFQETTTDPLTGASMTSAPYTSKVMHSYEDPYTYVSKNQNTIIYVPETGEILLSESQVNVLKGTKDNAATAADESEIQITYQKSNWEEGDLRPEHYFYCTSTDADGNEITYNESYITGNAEHQDIEYDVGFNQTIRVNSTAEECFQPGIGREADDIVNAMQNVLDLEEIKSNIESMLEDENVQTRSGDATILQNQLDAVNKAITYAKDKEQKLFEHGITTFQEYLDDASLSITNCGTRSSKLSLIKSRMQNQKTTFETLKSENEDVDITEVAIQLTSAELTYQAALMATGKVAQMTLLNYI